MLGVELIDTDVGSIAVVIRQVTIDNGDTLYCGSLLNNEHDIYIESYDRETCINMVADAFDIAMLFWVKSQLPNEFFNKKDINKK